jgi:hypothetical protein
LEVDLKTKLSLFLILIVLFICGPLMTSTFAAQGEKATISALDIEWNEESQVFDAFFFVKNPTIAEVELSGIILFKAKDEERAWRGFRMPTIPADNLRFFKVSFSPGFLLKNDYNSIAVNIYGKDYQNLIDTTSRHLTVKSQRVPGTGNAEIEIMEISPGYGRIEAEIVTNKQFFLGSKDDIARFISPEKGSYVVLTPVSNQDRGSIPGKISKAPMVDLEGKILQSPTISITTDSEHNTLFWNAVADVNRYNLYWSNSKGVTKYNGRQIKGVQSGYSHAHLNWNSTFYYVVTSEKNGRESAESNEVVVTPIVRMGEHKAIITKSAIVTLQAVESPQPEKSDAAEKVAAEEETEESAQADPEREADTNENVVAEDEEVEAVAASDTEAPENSEFAPADKKPEETFQKKGSRAMTYILTVLSIL